MPDPTYPEALDARPRAKAAASCGSSSSSRFALSRKVRLVLAEKGVGHELVRENPWEKRDEFIDLNPAGETPVMVEPDQASR